MEKALWKIEGICRRQGINLLPEEIQQLTKYMELLLDWNLRINLISRADVDNIWFSHILHSISILFFVDLPTGVPVLDLGTGGGLPGIPLAILRPDLKVTLVDSIRKKTMAVQDMVDKLRLENTVVLTGRAEELNKKPEHKHKFDIIVSRTVAPLNDLIKWSRPFAQRRSEAETVDSIQLKRKQFQTPYMLTLKGGDLSKELEIAKIKSGVRDCSVISLVFDGSEELGLSGKKIVVVPL